MAPHPSQNELLAPLDPALWRDLHPHLDWVELPLGAVLYEAGSTLDRVYLPATAIVSLVSPMKSGASAEVAVVGREGMVGVCAFMGGGRSLSSAVVQTAGYGLRMRAVAINDAAKASPELMQTLLRYTQSLFTQMAQTSACNRHHELGEQLCRWLLVNHDRVLGDDLLATHERIASMLGVRREGISVAALKLQAAGVISYRRGHITILDRAALERSSCECYAVIRRAYNHRLPQYACNDDEPEPGSEPAPAPRGWVPSGRSVRSAAKPEHRLVA